jgi:hypothetical protein
MTHEPCAYEAQHALDPQRHGPGDEERELLPLVGAQRPDEQQLDHHAQQEHGGDHQEDREERIQVELREQRVAQEGSEDDHHALGDVDDAHDPERERESARHQRIDAAREQPEDHGLDEQAHPSPPSGTRGLRNREPSDYPAQFGFGYTGSCNATSGG